MTPDIKNHHFRALMIPAARIGMTSSFLWLAAIQGIAAVDAAPELSFGRDNEVLIKWVGVGFNLNQFAAAGDHQHFDTQYV